MNDKLNTAQNLNLRLQEQLERVEQERDSLFGYIFELQKVAGASSDKLDTQGLYDRVKALAEAQAPEAEAGE